MSALAKSSEQGCAQQLARRDRRGHAAWPARQCPECLCSYAPHHALQLFCTVAHRDAWNNRIAVRARVLGPLALVSRITRQGTRGDRATGRRATADCHALLQRWVNEDRAAGRMAWPDYLRLRYAIGFDPLS